VCGPSNLSSYQSQSNTIFEVDELNDPACIGLPPHVRDRDIFYDAAGRVFVVLGHIQPSDRILSFLKYVPDQLGDWQSGDVKYRRIFWGSVSSTVDGMNLLPSDYIVSDAHFGTELLEPPRESVAKYFSPEIRLREIIEQGPRDTLEGLVKRGADTLHDELGLPYDSIGVAGSILWKGHSIERSDINMNVYGFDTSWTLEGNYESLVEGRTDARLRELVDWRHAMARVYERVPIMKTEDLENLFTRRKALCLDDVCIGITPILLPDEVPIHYASESYIPISPKPVAITMDIENADYGLFHPSIYDVNTPPVEAIDGDSVSRVMVYDGAFGGLLRTGDQVEVTGTLQRVVPTSDESPFYQVMVGTKTGAGLEYIRLLV
jgi:predicted nucleotidyltransferase